MLRTTYNHLNTVQKGSLGEAFSKMAFTLEGFEVYDSEYDDRGIDFVVRNSSGRFLSVQVKATDKTANPFIKEDKFSDADDFVFCAVRLIDGESPALFLARGLALVARCLIAPQLHGRGAWPCAPRFPRARADSARSDRRW